MPGQPHEVDSVIQFASRGDTISVANDNARLQRYGREDRQGHRVEEDQGAGHIRVYGDLVCFTKGGIFTGPIRYYQAQLIVPALSSSPLGGGRERVLEVRVFHAGLETTNARALESLFTGVIELLAGDKYFVPLLSPVKLPLIEPATNVPGQFLTYDASRIIMDLAEDDHSREPRGEAMAPTQTVKVTFLGYRDTLTPRAAVGDPAETTGARERSCSP